VEITAENAAPRLGATIRTAFEWECQAHGRRDRRICESSTSRTRHLQVIAYGVKPGALLHSVLPVRCLPEPSGTTVWPSPRRSGQWPLCRRSSFRGQCVHRGRARFRQAGRSRFKTQGTLKVSCICVTKGMEPPSRMKTAFLPKPFSRALCAFLENRVVVRSHPGLSHA